MTDRELLELAAKAAGFKKYISHHLGRDSFVTYDEEYYSEVKECRVTGEKTLDWNPLVDDGDALRLAVKLGVELVFTKNKIGAGRRNLSTYPGVNEDRNVDDHYATTRRAIVRAAAEIGKQMEAKP